MVAKNATPKKYGQYRFATQWMACFLLDFSKKSIKICICQKKNVFLQRKKLFNLCQENNLIKYPIWLHVSVRLPMYYDLKDEEVVEICKLIKKYMEKT